jgi:hypothetical protein
MLVEIQLAFVDQWLRGVRELLTALLLLAVAGLLGRRLRGASPLLRPHADASARHRHRAVPAHGLLAARAGSVEPAPCGRWVDSAGRPLELPQEG